MINRIIKHAVIVFLSFFIPRMALESIKKEIVNTTFKSSIIYINIINSLVYIIPIVTIVITLSDIYLFYNYESTSQYIEEEKKGKNHKQTYFEYVQERLNIERLLR